jgi:hypothetical protein
MLVDDRRLLTVAVLPVVPGRGRDDRSEQLEGGHDRSLVASVPTGLAQELAPHLVELSDAEHAELVGLRSAVEGDDAIAR